MTEAGLSGSVLVGSTVKANTEGMEVARRATELEDEPAKTVFQTGGVEVHHEACADSAHSQVGQQLGFMCRDKLRLGFDFKNNRFIHDDVSSEAQWQGPPFITYRDGRFAPMGNPCLSQFVRQTFAIDGLKQPRPNRAMYRDPQPNNPLRQSPRLQPKKTSVALRATSVISLFSFNNP